MTDNRDWPVSALVGNARKKQRNFSDILNVVNYVNRAAQHDVFHDLVFRNSKYFRLLGNLLFDKRCLHETRQMTLARTPCSAPLLRAHVPAQEAMFAVTYAELERRASLE